MDLRVANPPLSEPDAQILCATPRTIALRFSSNTLKTIVLVTYTYDNIKGRELQLICCYESWRQDFPIRLSKMDSNNVVCGTSSVLRTQTSQWRLLLLCGEHVSMKPSQESHAAILIVNLQDGHVYIVVVFPFKFLLPCMILFKMIVIWNITEAMKHVSDSSNNSSSGISHSYLGDFQAVYVQGDLNELVRDLAFSQEATKIFAEILVSCVSKHRVLDSETKIIFYRNRYKELVHYLMKTVLRLQQHPRPSVSVYIPWIQYGNQ